MSLTRSDLVIWEVDLVGENGMTFYRQCIVETALFVNVEHFGWIWNLTLQCVQAMHVKHG